MTIPASNGKTVLITGINGYIASVLGQLLLSKGYSIRGTTRSSASSNPLLNGPYQPYKERVQIYEIPDMIASGAFDEAAKGVHGIFHVASPISLGYGSYETTIVPAVKLTGNIFDSALKAGPQLSSVVVTSSVAAVTNPTDVPGREFTEDDFSTYALQRANEDRAQGVQTVWGLLYAASKAAAERAVWEFKKENNPSFAVSTVNPSVVIGPPAVLPASGSQLNMTLLPIYNILSGTAKEIPPKIGSGGYVDVRDVATIHLWAYENPEKANGERYIASAGFGPPQGVADILRKKYEGTKIAEKILVGVPGAGYIGYNKETGEVAHVEYPPENARPNGKKAEKAAGIKYIPFTQSVIDTAVAMEPLL